MFFYTDCHYYYLSIFFYIEVFCIESAGVARHSKIATTNAIRHTKMNSSLMLHACPPGDAFSLLKSSTAQKLPPQMSSVVQNKLIAHARLANLFGLLHSHAMRVVPAVTGCHWEWWCWIKLPWCPMWWGWEMLIGKLQQWIIKTSTVCHKIL